MTCIRFDNGSETYLINDLHAGKDPQLSIPAVKKTGQMVYHPFGGVCDHDYDGDKKPVRLYGISEFLWDENEKEGYKIPPGHYVLGFFIGGRYYIAIKDDMPVHWG